MADDAAPTAEPAAPEGWLDLPATAAVVGGWAWLDERLFEVVGGWVPTTPEPAAKVHLAAQSRRHGWHARLWRDRLPELREHPVSQLVAPPDEPTRRLVAALAELEGTTDRLVALSRVVLPHLIGTHGARLEVLSDVADASLARTIRHVLLDERDDHDALDVLVRARVGTPEEIDAAAAVQARLEATLGVAS